LAKQGGNKNTNYTASEKDVITGRVERDEQNPGQGEVRRDPRRGRGQNVDLLSHAGSPLKSAAVKMTRPEKNRAFTGENSN